MQIRYVLMFKVVVRKESGFRPEVGKCGPSSERSGAQSHTYGNHLLDRSRMAARRSTRTISACLLHTVSVFTGHIYCTNKKYPYVHLKSENYNNLLLQSSFNVNQLRAIVFLLYFSLNRSDVVVDAGLGLLCGGFLRYYPELKHLFKQSTRVY